MGKNLFFNGPAKNRHELLPWSPSILPPPKEGYYALPANVVWIPIHTLTDNAVNPGHLLLDYFLPIFTLLSMFGHENKLVPFVTDHNRYCTQSRANNCMTMVSKFIPLVGVKPGSFSNSLNNFEFNVVNNETRSNIVCAKHALAGIGMLNDHGRNKHGQLMSDYERMRNIGRGPEIYRFREFMLRNMGIAEEEQVRQPPYQILFSMNSTGSPRRRRTFEAQLAALERGLSSEEVTTKALVLADLTIQEQVRAVADSSVYVSAMGGSAVFATFLPRGSTVVLYFDDVNDWAKGRGAREKRLRPVMMDWDLFNNAAHLRVHWFPLSTMDNEEDLKLFVATIRKDIESLLHEL